MILVKKSAELNVNADTIIKSVKLAELNIKITRDDSIKYKPLFCNGNYQKKFDENLKKRFFNTCKLFNHDINEFILLLQKNVYSMNIWMIGKNSVKHHYLKKKVSTIT